MAAKPRGRPRKYAEYDELLAKLPKLMTKRPRYVNGIGVFRGATGDTAWLKLRLPNGGLYKGKRYAPGKSLEIKLGNLPSWSWAQLEAKHKELQGKADRGEPLEDVQVPLFSERAADWLSRAKSRLKGYDTSRLHVSNHLLPSFGNLILSEIQVQHVNRWIADRLSVAKPSTVKRELNTLNAILNDAVRSGLIDANPGRY
ncbi:MAG: site-specific integrase, partial [Proteobacteria bacterium]|nr:site-specific integrase [Pseudomonadota bacterium]